MQVSHPLRRREDEAAQGLKRLAFLFALCAAVAIVYIGTVVVMSLERAL